MSCLIALAGISAILGSFLSGRLASTGAKHWTQAMNLARARIEYLQSLRYTDLSSMAGVTVEPDVALDERDEGNSFQCTRYSAMTPEEDGITIAVLISWEEKSVGAGFTPWTYQLKTWVSSPRPPSMAGS